MSAHRNDTDRQSMLGRLETLTVVAIVGILALALGLAALAMPSTTAKAQKLAYTQSGSFSYSATAPATSVYGAKGLTSGQAIITKIVGPVKAAFDYKLSSDVPADVHGTAALDVTVDLGQGFSKTFQVAAAQPFTGDHATTSGVLPLAAIRAYADGAARDLGNTGAVAETVTLRPEITLSGIVGQQRLQPTTYEPTLPFAMTGATLAISNGGSATGTDTTAADSLHPSAQGAIGYQASEPNTLPLLVVHPQVRDAMIAGFGLAGLCLLLCMWLARSLRSGKSPGDRERIRTLYGSQLVPVDNFAVPEGPVADVATIEALADLAKRYESMIMHLEESDADIYLVWDNGMLYRYCAPHQAPVAADEDDTVEPTAAAEEVIERGTVQHTKVDKRKRDQRTLADVSSILTVPSYLEPSRSHVGATGIDGSSLGDDLIERLFNGQAHTD